MQKESLFKNRMDGMQLFATAGKTRGYNDKANKLRETILVSLSTQQTTDPELQPISTQWNQCIRSLCPVPYDTLLCTKQAGRGKNYDFDIVYHKDSQLVHSVKAEFKHNARTITKLPQYWSPSADKPYLPVLYADFFYDNYIDEIQKFVSVPKPTKDTYLQMVHQDNYSIHPFFKALYDQEESFYKQKQALVRESIAIYLANYGSLLDCVKLSEDIRSRQQGKTFLLWDKSTFHVETLTDEELDITGIHSITKNKIIVATRGTAKHELLLRWKNHLGVLFPAWQISLTR